VADDDPGFDVNCPKCPRQMRYVTSRARSHICDARSTGAGGSPKTAGSIRSWRRPRCWMPCWTPYERIADNPCRGRVSRLQHADSAWARPTHPGGALPLSCLPRWTCVRRTREKTRPHAAVGRFDRDRRRNTACSR